MINNETPGSSKQNETSVRERSRSSALDHSFPSLWIMGGAILVVCLAIALMGWKVISLESEVELVEREKILLQQNISQHDSILRELPGLKEEHSEIVRSIAIHSGELETIKASLNSAEVRLGEARAEYNSARAGSEIAEQEEMAFRDRVVELRARQEELAPIVLQLSNQETELRSTLDVLTRQRDSLKNENSDLQNEKDQLKATLNGLRTQIGVQKETLASLAREQGEIDSLAENFQSILQKFEQAESRAESTLDTLDKENRRLVEVVTSVKDGSSNLNSVINAIESQTRKFQELNETILAEHNYFSQIVSDVSDKIDNLSTISETLKSSVTATSQAGNDLRSVTEGLSPIKELMGSIVNKLKTRDNELEQGIATLNEKVQQLTNINQETQILLAVIEQGGQNAESAAQSLQHVSENASKTMEDIQNTGSALAEQAAGFGGIYEDLKTKVYFFESFEEEAGGLINSLGELEQAVQATLKPIDEHGKNFADWVTRFQIGLESLLDNLERLQLHIDTLGQVAESAAMLTAEDDPAPSNQEE